MNMNERLRQYALRVSLRGLSLARVALKRADRRLQELRLELELRHCIYTLGDLDRMMEEMGWKMRALDSSS